ncbi:hypothetical protein FI667_g9185, partial [Globisporangium splendens]
MLTVQLDDEQILNDILNQFSVCKSLEELVRCANAMPASIPAFGSKLSNATLFMVTSTASGSENTWSSTSSIWTIAASEANQCGKIELVGGQSGNGRPASGIPSYVLHTQEPLSYSKDHRAFATMWHEFFLSRYEYEYFYAVPLSAGKSEPAAVLEFAFELETQRMDFLANSRLRDSIIDIVSCSVARLQHFSEKESRACQELDSLREIYERVLSKWVDIVAEWSTLPLDDFGTWKSAVGALVHKFLPTCDFVNILSADENLADGEGAIIDSIFKEVSTPPHSSSTLNVMNQAILQTCMVLPLVRKMGSNDVEAVKGLIAFSKRSDEPFTSEEQQLGSLMFSLLSHQVAFFNDKHVTEVSIASMEKQLLEHLETLKHVDERSKCVLNECQRKRVLLQVSAICNDNLMSSASVEQLCEAVTLATRNVSLAADHTGENAVSGDLIVKMCFLLWDANESSFRLVTGHPGSRHHAFVRVSEMGCDKESNNPRFSKSRVRVHDSPFAKLPPRLLQGLGVSRQDPAYHSISLVPMINSDDSEEAFFGLLAFANGAYFDATNDFLLEMAECVRKICKFKRGCKASSAVSKQLQDNVSRLQAELHEEKLSNQVFTLAHELWTRAMTVPTAVGGKFDEYKSRIQHQFTESFIKTFRDIVNLTSVELAIGSGANDVFLRSDTTKMSRSDESAFVKQLKAPDQDGSCVLGRLHIAWKPEGTTLEGHRLVTHLEWLSDFLQSLLSHCLTVEEVRHRSGQNEAQCLALKSQVQDGTEILTRMEQERERWALLHEAVMASVALLKAPEEIDCVDDLVEPSSSWYRLFSAIEVFSDRSLKLWLTSEQHEYLWTVADGKVKTWNLALSNERLPKSFVVLTSAEPIAETRGSDGSSSRPLGYLEVMTQVEDDRLVTQLIAMITATLRCRTQASQIQCLEEHVQRVETVSNEHARAWKQHWHAWSTRLLCVQTRIKAWTSNRVKNAQPVSKSEDWCKELLGLVENSLLHESESSPCQLRHSGPKLIQFRSYLRIERDACCHSSLIHSCTTDCEQCSSPDTLKMIDELGALLQERGDIKTLTFDLSATASNELSCGGANHPTLSLVHSDCQKKHATAWKIVNVSKNDEERSTHRFLVHIADRSSSTIGSIRLVSVAVMEKSDLIDDSSVDFAFNLCGELVLDGLSEVQDSALTREGTGNLNRQLISAAEALSESSRDRAIVEDVVKEIGCAFHESLAWKDAEPKLHKIVGSILSMMTGSPVQARICLCPEALSSETHWEMIGGKDDTHARHDLLQSVQSMIGNAASEDEQLSCIRLDTQSKGDVFRFFYRLSDANHAEIGVLVLDTRSDLSLLAVRGFDNVFVFIRQFVSGAMGLWREKTKHANQIQSLCEEREQLLLEKSQLELNSLEMKNLLHRNEVNLVALRNHIDHVICSTSKLVDSYLADLEAIESPKQVLVGLGNTISAMENIRDVHLNLLSKKARSDPPLFTSMTKAEDKRVVRSDEVKEAIRACIKQSEVITVCANGAPCKSQGREDDLDLKVASIKGVKSVSVFPIPIAAIEEIDSASKAEESKDVSKVSQETKAVLIVLADQPDGVPPSPGSFTSMHQIQQIKVLIQAAVVRCHALVQGALWKRQVALMTDKETNAERQLALLEHKCSQLQSKHDQHTQLYCGLTNQMSLALPALHSESSKAMRSKQLLEMWQHLTEIIKGRLESAFREREFVRRGGFHLFGAVAEGNFFFSISGSAESFGEKQFQFLPIQSTSKDATHQALRKAFVSENTVEEAQEDAKRDIGDVSIHVPMIGATREDQGQERVVAILKVCCYSAPLLSSQACDTVGQARREGHEQMDIVYSSIQENGDEDEDDDEKSDSEDKIRQKRRDALLPGIISLLIKVQEAASLRSLKAAVEWEFKALWSSRKIAARMKVFDCRLYSDDELFTERRGEEQFWLLSMCGTNTEIGEPAYHLVIRGSYLDEVFNADDEQVHLPQLARCIHRQISQLNKANAAQNELSQLQEAKMQAPSLAVKSHQLEQTVSDMSSFAEFVSALSGVESERALSNLVTAYLKKLLACDRVAFQLCHSTSTNPAEEPDRVVRGEHSDGSLDEAADVATATLEMDNALRLRIPSPYHGGNELLAVCVARMGSMTTPLNAQKQDLLRQMAPIIGSALHRIQTEAKLSHQLRVNDGAQSEIGRLVAEKKELQKQQQHQLQAHDDFQLRLGDQNALAAENKRLEAQISKMVSRLEAYARETSEQQSVLVARDKTITQLSFELGQSAKVGAQLRYMEEENAERQQRETKLEKKILKQRLQPKNLVSELGSLKQKESFNQHEIAQLQRQIAVMSERQQQTSATVKSSSTRRSRSSRLYDQMQQQIQRRKQLNLAQELRQLAAMEVREMKVRNREQREKSQDYQTQIREEKRSV